jgi:hypothetical protein
MQNPLCVSNKCLSAAIHSLLYVTFQQGQIHGMCHIFSIQWELCYINCLPKWLSLEIRNDNDSTKFYFIYSQALTKHARSVSL